MSGVMAKYDAQLGELKTQLLNAKNILITLPVGSNIDKFAAGLALFLSLKAAGKRASIVCDDTVLVAQSHLFGVDNISKTLPPTEGGNFVITLGGVAVADPAVPNGWKVPSLENLDWYGESGNLNLVFHVSAGQTFQPTSVTPHTQGTGFDLIFTIGSADLNSLGSIYSANQSAFSGVSLVNIDNQPGNTGFGNANILDTNSSNVSEMMADLIPSLNLPFDADMASNLLAGIFDTTASLTGNVGADTFLAVAQCLRVGGKRPFDSSSASLTAGAQGRPGQPSVSSQPSDINQPQPMVQPTSQPAGLDLSALIPKSAPAVPQPVTPSPVQNEFPNPPVVSQNNLAPETPVGEAVASSSELEAEPDWLTPKIFKGGQG